ncbi:MAG: ABC transporter substrate-binding protein [Candidatus Limivivens sp.]|nr:ABC transporter substrate-binding protein [Candidatus Limivivens sp.]
MKFRKKKETALLLLSACLICSAEAVQAEEAPVFTVGICQFTRHDSLDAATRGFKDTLTQELGEQVAFEEKEANGDNHICTILINDLVSREVDLILANSTNALQTAATATTEIPILGTAVTDFETALQQADFEGETEGNISGVSDLVPPEEQAALIRELFPEGTRVGILYCSSESNSRYQAEAIQELLKEKGYTCESYLFVDSSDLSSVTMTAASECGVLYIPTDNTVASNAGLIANICIPGGVPVITGDESTCRICGIASLSVNYYDLGCATGEMAVQILTGEKAISELPVQFASSFTKTYNPVICEQLGFEVPEDFAPLKDE